MTRLGNKLGRYKRADVTLVDKCRAHLWKPLLHEIGAGSMDLGVHEIDYLAQAHWHHFRYRIGELIGLDRRARAVHLAAHVDDEGQQVTQPRSFHYDTLVIAIGSQSNDFGTPGVREHALSLDTPLEAKRFHSRLVNAYIRGHAQSTPLRPEQLQVAIIGAGATGTELAAELHYTTRQVVAYGLDRIDSNTRHQDQSHRSGGPHIAGATRTVVEFGGCPFEGPRGARLCLIKSRRGRDKRSETCKRRIHSGGTRRLGRRR